MRYTLEELLQDKELRKQLLETAFTFADDEGDFFALDFQNESMRQNHITAFEVLYSIGGEALFEKILKEGNTCLANSPDAAKIGVKEIAGTKGWYLKTNASAYNAFSSIIYGLSALENTDRFTFSINEESSLYNIISKGSENYTTGLISGYEDIYTVEENEYGGFSVVCAEDGKKVVFFTMGLSWNGEISSFKTCEPILHTDVEYNEEKDELETKYTPIAYKYKLSEDGKWGFFNANFSQFIPPMFDDVILTSNENKVGIIAYSVLENWEFLENDGLEQSDKKIYQLYFGSNDSFELCDIKINMTYVCSVSEDYFPSENAIVDKIKLNKEDKEFVFYSSCGNPESGIIFIQEMVSRAVLGFCVKTLTGNKVKVENGVLKGENTKKALAVSENGTLTVEDYMKLYSDESFSYRAVERLYKDAYIVEKDGYLGIAKMAKPRQSGFGAYESLLELDEMLTPYAFTDMKLALSDNVIVDRFGKKGVFRINEKKYVIPCDYDKLVAMGFDRYRVAKADFTGVIEAASELRWLEKLHRED